MLSQYIKLTENTLGMRSYVKHIKGDNTACSVTVFIFITVLHQLSHTGTGNCNPTATGQNHTFISGKSQEPHTPHFQIPIPGTMRTADLIMTFLTHRKGIIRWLHHWKHCQHFCLCVYCHSVTHRPNKDFTVTTLSCWPH